MNGFTFAGRRAWRLLMVSLVMGGLLARLAQAEPAEPVVTWIFPAGAQRGTTVEIGVGGQMLDGATGARVTGAGVTVRVVSARASAGSTLPPSPAPSRRPAARRSPAPDTAALTLIVTVAPNAEPGWRDLRVITPGGISNRIRLAIGDLPELNENEPNSARDKAQRLSALPVVVNGQILEGDRDFYRFAARAQQTIVCRVDARAHHPYLADAVPGWFDPCLILYDANGRQLQTVDDFKLQPDPVLIFRVPRDGEYFVEVRDVLYRGRADFVYRLTVGELPYLTGLFPLGGQRGRTTRVTLSGANLPTTQAEVRVPRDGPVLRVVRAEGRGPGSNGLPFAASDLPSVAEIEPNDSLATAQVLKPPVVVDGRIDRPGDVDWYRVPGIRGQAIRMEIVARRLESPLDSVLSLFKPGGQRVSENDDTIDPTDGGLLTHHADSSLVYTFDADGDVVVRVRDAQGKGGPDFSYRLVVAPVQPDFALRVTPDHVRAVRGDHAVLTVEALRRYGFNGAIEVTVRGLPSGFSASPGTLAPGQDKIVLTVGIPSRVSPGIFQPVVTGMARMGDRTLERQAVPAEEVMQAFSYRQVLATMELVLAVLDTDGTSLVPARPLPSGIDIAPGGQFPLQVRVQRGATTRGGVGLRGVSPIAGVFVRGGWIPADKDEGTVTVVAGPRVPPGTRCNVVVTGTLRVGKETINRALPALPVRILGPAPTSSPSPAPR